MFDGSSWAASAGAGITLEDEGSTVAGGPHTTMNFVGDGVSVTNAGGGEATITVTGGGGGSGIGSATGFKGASVQRTSDQTIPDASDTRVQFDTVEFDSNSYFQTGSPSNETRLTVPETGYYLLTAFCRWTGSANGGRRLLRFYRNGSEQIGLHQVFPGTDTTDSAVSHTLAKVIYLDANDYIELGAYQDSGSSLTINSNDSSRYATLAIAKLETTTGAQSFSGAHVSRNSAQTIANSTITPLLFDTSVYDTDSYTSVGSPDSGLVVPADGYYQISAFVRWESNATGIRLIAITVNGTAYCSAVMDVDSATNHGHGTDITLFLSTNDVVGANVFQSSGGNLDTLASADSSYARLMIHRIASPGMVISNEGAGSPTVDQTFSEIRIGSGAELEDLGSGVARITVGEEGTWTPTYSTTGTDYTSVTYGDQLGYYKKIGSMVHVVCHIDTTAATIGSASGNLIVAGLPFTSKASYHNSGAVSISSAFATNQPTGVIVNPSTNYVRLWYKSSSNGNSSTMTAAELDTGNPGNNLFFAVTYFTDD